jgi:hypothetical protein
MTFLTNSGSTKTIIKNLLVLTGLTFACGCKFAPAPTHIAAIHTSAIIYQLRDAATAHTFDALHLPQSFIDKRDPIVWFHIYRGTKCASEKYAARLPCGASYHAADGFIFGGFKNPNRTDGELIPDEDHSTPLWNPDAK